MALDPSGLHDGVVAFLGASPASTAEAAANFAQAYDDYAQDAMFPPCTPTLDGCKAKLEAAVAASLASGIFATVCTAIGNGVAAYWTGVPVAGAGQAGAVPGCPGAASIAGALAALAPASPRATAATVLSGALHTATLTCTATVSPPLGTILDIA